MLEFFLNEATAPFFQNITSFPTVVFTVLLGVCVLYWLVAVLGFIDIDILDVNGDIDGDFSSPDVLSGLMLRYGLSGVPLTIIISIMSLFGWFVCFVFVHYMFAITPEGLYRLMAGISILGSSAYIALLVTSVVVKPVRPLFANINQEPMKHIVGQTVTVRTSVVDNDFGEAMLDDGGAGLILKIRTKGDDRFSKGDRVVLLERLNDSNVYRVISEQEFSA